MPDSTTDQPKAGLSDKQARLAKLLRGGVKTAPRGIQRQTKPGPFPLSFSQERLWFLDQLVPGSVAYHLPLKLRLSGRLDTAALERSLNTIVQRHASLRTTFDAVAGEPIQVVAPELSLRLPLVDLQNVLDPEREAALGRWIAAAMQQPFDLVCGPLVRPALLRLGAEEHVLLVLTHHIITDGWSFKVLVEELAALYAAYTGGTASELAELPIQYSDYADWQRERYRSGAAAVDLDYWKEQLGGKLPVLRLPTDRPRPPVQTYHGARHYFGIPQPLFQALKELGQRENVTLNVVLMAVFKTLLHRYTGLTDLLVGTLSANRTRTEIERLIGFFVNTLVIRTDLGGDPTFKELLARVRSTTTDAYTHSEATFEKVVEVVQPERDVSYTPLFQTLFVFQNIHAPTLALADLALSVEPVEGDTTQFDLSLEVSETVSRFVYNTDLFDADTIERLVGHFLTLLRGAVDQPGARVSALPMLTPHEREQALDTWNRTERPYPNDRCIHQLFEAQAERTPLAAAAVYAGQELSYAELNRRANQLAHHLQSLGVGPDVLVGVCVERSFDMLVAIYGILKAGGAYLPLDPTYPKERLAFMLEDTQATVVLTQERLAAQLPSTSAHVICLDTHQAVLEQASAQNPHSRVAPDNLIYVIYTSGSTGRPKGAMISHRSLVNHNTALLGAFGLGAGDRILQFASISFDAAAVELFPPLISGATLVLHGERMLSFSTDFLDLVERERLTVLNLPTAYWHQWVQAVASAARRLPDCLRLVHVGGEKTTPDQFQVWQRLAGDRVRWVNGYGPTEATITTTLYEPPSADGPALADIPIGQPIANLRTYVLDAHLQPAPVGVPGELYIAEVGLARGYHKRADLTAERFIPNPFGDGRPDSQRLYRTGDLVRYQPDGNIQFLGRVDHQVKIRGFRIELAEIEAALHQHPAVAEAVVIAREDTPNDKRLAAYLIAKQQQSVSVSDLRAFLKARLPEYMHPSSFTTLESFPLTTNRKIDLKRLPVPDQQRPELEHAYVAPRNETERALTAIWQELLGVEKVGVLDNFFDLGGNSLLMVRLHTRLRETYPREIKLIDLFQYPNISGLTDLLTSSEPAPSLVAQVDDLALRQREALRKQQQKARTRLHG